MEEVSAAHAALLRRGALATDGEDVVPAVGVEHVGQQRSAQQGAHLVARQARTELRDHVLGDHIALHDFHAVRRDEAEQRADGKGLVDLLEDDRHGGKAEVERAAVGDRHGSHCKRIDSDLYATSTTRPSDERLHHGLRRLHADRRPRHRCGGVAHWGTRRADRCGWAGTHRHGVRSGAVADDPLARGGAPGARSSRFQPHQSLS